MYVARLRAEANQELFDFDDISMIWLPDMHGVDPIIAQDWDGNPVTAGDFIRAGLVMMWSMVVEQAALAGLEPAVLVTQLGLSLAQYEPGDEGLTE